MLLTIIATCSFGKTQPFVLSVFDLIVFRYLLHLINIKIITNYYNCLFRDLRLGRRSGTIQEGNPDIPLPIQDTPRPVATFTPNDKVL